MCKTASRKQRIVLLGGGHAHVEVVRRIGLARIPCEVILVSPARYSPYSGMLPGYVAGRYAFEDFHIDLEALCARANVDFHAGTAVDIAVAARHVSLADGSILAYDILSLDIGSTPSLPAGVSEGVAVKPISNFANKLVFLDTKVRSSSTRFQIAVVGQGVAGVEIAFALNQRFRGAPVSTGDDPEGVDIILLGRGPEILPERSARARRFVAAALERARIEIRHGFDACSFENGVLRSSDGRMLVADECVWTTSSAAPGWLRQTGLSLDDSGFVRVDENLRSPSHPQVFAAGDVAALADPRPKAGVFAVRQGPVLADNLIATLTGRPFVAFMPQRSWLALVSLGDGRTVADKWGLAVAGRWVSAWKHWNDTRFIRRYAPSC